MYRTYKTKGIVLRFFDSGEYNRRFVVYTEDFGKLIFEAVGIRKIESKLAPHFAYPALLSLVFIQANETFRIIDVSQSEVYGGEFISFIALAVDSVTPLQEPDEKLWSALVSALRFTSKKVSCTPRYADLFKKKFLMHLFALQGFVNHADFKDKSTGEISLKDVSSILPGEMLESIIHIWP